MKRLPLVVVAFCATVATAHANPPVVIVQPAPKPVTISPLTTSTSSNNQALLNQITNSLNQQRFQHQVTTTQAALRTQAINAAQTRSSAAREEN